MMTVNNRNDNSVFDDLNGYVSKKKISKIGRNSSLSGRSNNSEYKVKNGSKSEAFLKRVADAGYDLSQLGDIIKMPGSELIVSCAGSGKTTGLLFKIIYDTLTGELVVKKEINGNIISVMDKVLVTTFLKSGALELQNRLRKMVAYFGVFDMSKGIKFSTLHAEFKRTIEDLGIKVNIISQKDNTKLLREVLSMADIKYNGRALNSEMVSDLESALEYSRNRIDAERYNKDIYSTLDINPSLLDFILSEWKLKRENRMQFDFTDLQEILYNLCYTKDDKRVIKYISGRYNYIYLDEFQDTSQMQYEVLKIYAKGSKKIVAIGDDDQCIYSWRGSCSSIMTDNFKEDMLANVGVLSHNYRCPSNILNPVIPSIQLNKGRIEKDLLASKEGGRLKLYEFSTISNMAKKLETLVTENMKQRESVAILCRINADGLIPAMVLNNIKGLEYSISGDGMNLGSYIGNLVFGIVKLITEGSGKGISGILNTLQYGVNSEIKMLLDYCKQESISIWQVRNEDLEYSNSGVLKIIKSWKEVRYGDVLGTIGEGGYRSQGEKDLDVLRYLFEYFKFEVFGRKDNQFNRNVNTVIDAFIYVLSEGGYDDVNDYMMRMEDIKDKLFNRTEKSSKRSVNVCTVHEFKGKEADVTYIWNDTQGSFPHIIKGKEITQEELQEERRVHYIACTRAKEENNIFTLKGREGLFLSEMLAKSDIERVNGDKVEVEIKEDEGSRVLRELSGEQQRVKGVLKKGKYKDMLDSIQENIVGVGRDDNSRDLNEYIQDSAEMYDVDWGSIR